MSFPPRVLARGTLGWPPILLAVALAAVARGADETAPADIAVTADVVAASPQPFGLNQLNGHWGGNNLSVDSSVSAMEPLFYRDRYWVTATGTTAGGLRYFSANNLSAYTTWADGFWDGATVRAYRVVTGTDGRQIYGMVGSGTVAGSKLGREFWLVDFGVNTSLNKTVKNASNQDVTVNFVTAQVAAPKRAAT